MSLTSPRSTLFPYTTLFRSPLLGEFGTAGSVIATPVNHLKPKPVVVGTAGPGGSTVADNCPFADPPTQFVEGVGAIKIVRSEEHTSELQSHVNRYCGFWL